MRRRLQRACQPAHTRLPDPGRPQRGALPALLVALVLLATACASTAERAFSTEKLLVAAGFHYKTADTPQQMEKLRRLPQDQMIRHQIEGKPIYVYALADACRCRYVGDESAYRRYVELRREAVLNKRMEKGAAGGGSLFSADESDAAVLDDLASGIIPGY